MKRHGDHHQHTINVKYGYILLLLYSLHSLIILSHSYISSYAIISPPSHTTPSKLLLKISRPPLYVTVPIWITLVLVLAVWNVTSWHVSIKRLGRLSYTLSNFAILLALRPPYWNYLSLVNLHKWISRLIIATGTIHGLGYILKWIIESTTMNILTLVNFIGAVVLVSSLVLLTASLVKINHRVFMIIHNLTLLLFVGLIQLHARPGVSIFFIINCCLLGLNLYWRYKSLRIVELNITIFPETNFKIIEFEMDMDYFLGDHIRLYPSWKLWESHPFTISSTKSNNSTKITLVTTSKTPLMSESYRLSGPYPFATTFPLSSFTTVRNTETQLNRVDNFVILVGGSGISMGLPFQEYFKKLSSSTQSYPNENEPQFSGFGEYNGFDNETPNDGMSDPNHIQDEARRGRTSRSGRPSRSSRRSSRSGRRSRSRRRSSIMPVERNFRFIWCVRSKSDILILSKLGFVGDIDVYVTGDDDEFSSPQDNGIDLQEEGERLLNDDIELSTFDETHEPEHAVTTKIEQSEQCDNSRQIGIKYFKGRPNSSNIFENALNNNLLLCCGPNGMVDEYKQKSKESDFNFWGEVYEI